MNVVPAASLDSKQQQRDKHLRSADFFHVDRHPTVTFATRKVTALGADRVRVEGDLTAAGHTLPLTFEATREAGLSIGSGAVVVFDESADLAEVVLRIARFFREESCGQCVPCRVGTVRQEEALRRLFGGKPLGSREEELVRLRDIAQVMRDASICGLGQTAANAVQSALGPFLESS